MFRSKAAAPRAHWSVLSAPNFAGTGIVRNKALLIGSVVFASTRDTKIPGYTGLTPRAGAGALQAMLSKQSPRLFVAIKDDVVRSVPKSTRFALAVDAYLQWGMKSQGKALLIGGYEDDQSTHLDIFAFEGGHFVSYDSKTLPAKNSPHFSDTVASLLEDCAQQWQGFALYQAAPLTAFGEKSGVRYIDGRIFKRLSFRPLASRSRSKLSGLTIPGVVVAAGMLFCVGAVGKGWADYHAAIEAFDHEIADPIVKGQGGVDSGLIDTIQQRRFYLDEPRRQVSLVEKSKSLVAGVGKIESLRIVEMKLPAPALGVPSPNIGVPVLNTEAASGPDRKPDVWLRVSVPAQADSSILGQGKELMTQVSNHTGMDVRLARNGWSEDGKRRVYTLEGFING